MFPSDSNLEAQFTFESRGHLLPEIEPFHILFLGDWSGGGEDRKSFNFSSLESIEIDRDNFDDVLSKLNLRLSLTIDESNSLTLKFDHLDDFHPDNIFQQVSLFSELRDLRKRLQNENSFNKAASEVKSWFLEKESSASQPIQDISQSQVFRVGSDNLLDSILDQSSSKSPDKSSQTSHSKELYSFLLKIVKPHIVQIDENEQAKFLRIIDEATSDLMRSIIHHPKFQELESAWRALFFMVRNIETNAKLKLFLIDITKEELTHNLKSVNSLPDADIYKYIVGESIVDSYGKPFAILCGNYTFGVNVDDIATLIRLGEVSSAIKAPFVSQILPEMFKLPSLHNQDLDNLSVAEDSNEAKLWMLLRSRPESNFVGLMMPRFLSRLPYGKASDPVETFSFEEFQENPAHDEFLWSNPSFLCALLFAQTFTESGWNINQRFLSSISGLPFYVFDENGKTNTKYSAEALMTDTFCRTLLNEGIMPLISSKTTDQIKLPNIKSVSNISSTLAGRWR